jgi:hypothetical protein
VTAADRLIDAVRRWLARLHRRGIVGPVCRTLGHRTRTERVSAVVDGARRWVSAEVCIDCGEVLR